MKRTNRSRQETDEEEQIVMDKLLKPQLKSDSSDINVPRRPYDGAIGGVYTTVTYEDRQMLTRSKVFED